MKKFIDHNDDTSSQTDPFIIDSITHSKILKIASEYLILSANLDVLFEQNNVTEYYKEFKLSIIKPLESKLKIFSKNESNERIKKFIKQRVDNFKDAPSKMIDSCLERSH